MKNIMIVDDSATMLMSLRSSLEMSGFRVEAATDGVQAMERLKGGYKPDLIITDINMPNMGGLELIAKVRTLPGMRFLPVLALTTESQQEKRDEAKRNGATGWLVKPINAADLLSVIKQVLPGV
ncbi:response regulator [Erwinia sp. D4-22]